MFTVQPSIDPALAAIAPGFRALSITVEAAPLRHPEVADAALADACRAVTAGEAPWSEAHLAAWAEVFKRFGAKPKRTPCSAEALRKRVARDGNVPGIDPVVDLYNAVSIRFAIPVGGENIAAYHGAPRLTLADGTELFDTVKEGEPAHESPEPGEVIWRDDTGVTCRRWNWRQGVRTRLDANATQMWFILESLPEMPLEALNAAGEMLVTGLQQMMPGAVIGKQLIGFTQPDAGH
ncbi:B3/4 domain-containing protein (plasmid) [Chimaeribacter arupi]|uniref:B3/B4 domain-containing protein n=1 Tax=Chimaeribacter arupi TaxID=2060066 RepID=UPI002711DCE8|nr:B3/4 domain-containing protein [Chimaeribacter arupi]WKZ94904.1 B3/4 domain-containing protein [Chimaeribacter arupi]